MRTREWLAALVTALLLLGLVLARVVARFALPGSKVVDIGALSDFPPSEQPYELHDLPASASPLRQLPFWQFGTAHPVYGASVGWLTGRGLS